jgi:hypothetical protein
MAWIMLALIPLAFYLGIRHERRLFDKAALRAQGPAPAAGQGE